MFQVHLIAENFLSVLGNDTFRSSLLNLSDFRVFKGLASHFIGPLTRYYC